MTAVNGDGVARDTAALAAKMVAVLSEIDADLLVVAGRLLDTEARAEFVADLRVVADTCDQVVFGLVEVES